MSTGHIIPLTPPPPAAVAAPAALPAPLETWGRPPQPPQGGSQLQRLTSVLRRFKWLILALTLLGTAAGIVATRFIDPVYEASAKIWIAGETPQRADPDPTRAPELVGANAWVPLFRSGAVTDEVVRQLGLFVTPENEADTSLVRSIRLDERFRPGPYELTVRGRTMELAYAGSTVDQAAVGDSIGRLQGLFWRPDPAALRGDRTIRFTVVQPREAGVRLNTRLEPQLEENFLTLTLRGTNPEATTATLNLWLQRFVSVAETIKKRKLTEAANAQTTNLERSVEQLEAAELALSRYRVGTITLPAEGTPVAGGVAETQPTVMTSFFEQRIRLEELASVRQQLERMQQSARANGRLSDADLFLLPSLTTGQQNVAIATTINELNQKQAEYRANSRIYTDSSEFLQTLAREISNLQRVTIPNQVNTLLAQIRSQESALRSRTREAEGELRGIPPRAIEEQRLKRNVEVLANLNGSLQASAQQARLAVASASPDVEVLDWPTIPSKPASNTIPQILGGAVLGSLLLGILLAFLIDRVDQRFRYPEQAKNDLGLDILGTVPRLRSAKRGVSDPEEAAQVLESFRLIRLNVRQAAEDATSLALTVSSATAGDGKSLVASNLAVSFAEAGHRVLLVDGDIRRGALHEAFGVAQRPGLADVLAGSATRKDAVRPTQHRNLTLLPCGARSRQAPELLDSAAMTELLAQTRALYDVVIIDSPPLSAGLDARALGMASGMMLLVLRAGQTNMRHAQTSLASIDRLPVFLAGAVLNCIEAKGMYEYYAYDYGYADDGETGEGESGEGVALPPGGAPQIGGETGAGPTVRA
jgi:capsular exopolysaccharide synthesis family protein